MILVAMPYWRAADYIHEAVTSIMAQTYRDFVCLVAGDGDTPYVNVRDNRLRIIDFPTNEGAPMTQQAMLLGSPHEWYAPFGADDWADPDYLAKLMALDGDARGSRVVWLHRDNGVGARLASTAWVEFGVFRAGLLRSVGGYGVDRRCGQDTLLYENVLPLVAEVAWQTSPAYHKRLHAGSLTQSKETGFHSPYRNEVIHHNRKVAERCGNLRNAERIREYRDTLLTDAMRATLAERTDAVRTLLS